MAPTRSDISSGFRAASSKSSSLVWSRFAKIENHSTHVFPIMMISLSYPLIAAWGITGYLVCIAIYRLFLLVHIPLSELVDTVRVVFIVLTS